MTDFTQVTVAINSEEGARKIAETLITKRLAASVWVSGPITSTYWWKGKAEQATEWVCTIKTRDELYDEIEHIIKELHPYEVPGILATSVTRGSQDYFDWINRETGMNGQQDQATISKEQLIQELIDAHEKLIATASTAHERGVRRTGDAWGPREVLAHIAGWEALAVARLPGILAGIPPVKYATEAQHAAMDDAINATVITMIGDQSFDTICTLLRKTYQADVQLISELDERIVRPGSYIYERTKAAIDHCHEHMQVLGQLDCSNDEQMQS